MKRYCLIIDHESCWGCKTCEVACKQENRAPDGIKLITVREDGPKVVEGRLDFSFRVDVCRHCDEPACVGRLPRRGDFQAGGRHRGPGRGEVHRLWALPGGLPL